MKPEVIREGTPLRSLSGQVSSIRRAALPLGALAAALPLSFVVSDFALFQLTLVMVYAIAVLGLNILTGFSGQFSLGHSAFFALGAYTGAIAMEQWGVHYALTPIIAGLSCFMLGYAIGIPASRLAGAYLAVATFALAIAMPKLLKLSLIEGYTGGVQGIFVTPPPAPAYIPLSDGQWLYVFVLGWLVLFFVLAWNLLDSRLGRAMLAIRENIIAAKAAGVDTVQVKATAFALSAFYTGAAGALGALTVQFIAPESYTLIFSIALLVGLVTGGVGSIAGTLFGAAFVLYVPNFADEISKSLSGAIYAAILIAVVFFLPEGAAGGVRLLKERFAKKPVGGTQ
jgi:branched-chain amino acid transport system permease protein